MKKQYSRKIKALRRIAALLCLMLAMQLLELYDFTPGAAMRDLERELGIGRTETIARDHFSREMTAVLAGWEDRLLLTERRWDPLMGWRVDNGRLYRRDSGKTVHLEGYAAGNTEAMYLWLCGWVTDPDVTELKLRVRCRQWYGVDGDRQDVYLTVSEFIPWQGERVFLLTSRDIPLTYTMEAVYWITEQGEELLLQE